MTTPTSFRGSKTIIGVAVVFIAVLGITILSIRMRTSAELEFYKRKNAIVKTENEQANNKEIKGLES